MKKLLVTLPLIVLVISLAACGGGGGSSSTTPPPVTGGSGGYTNASLTGTWVFNARGSGTSDDFAVLGVFTSDGNGNVTSGSQDVNDSASGYKPSQAITGTYSISSDGRGQMQLNYTGGNAIFRFVLTSTGAARLFEVSGVEDATGQMFKQDSTAIANLSGTYVLRLDGYVGGYIDSVIGQVTASAGPASGTLAATFDENYSGTVTQQLADSGTFAMATGGRGTAALTGAAGTFNLVYYIVSASHVEIMETDTNAVIAGGADLQGTGFSTAAFNGPFVFSIAGLANSGATAYSIREIGRIALDGSGNITAGAEDYNFGGAFYENVPYTGTYSVAPNGRFTLHFVYASGTADYFGWLTSAQSGVLLTNDANAVESGALKFQSVSPTLATLNGNYGLAFSGPNYTGNYNVEFTSALKFDGAGNIAGSQDFQAGGTLVPNAALTGTYTVGTNGHFSGSFPGSPALPFRLYVADATTAYFIPADSGRGYSGVLTAQQ
jgi:hypothetical protein